MKYTATMKESDSVSYIFNDDQQAIIWFKSLYFDHNMDVNHLHRNYNNGTSDIVISIEDIIT